MQSTKGLKTVCIFDPAIAKAVPAEELIAYARSRKYADIEKYITKGDPPAVYHYRRLSRSVMDRYVDVQPSDEGKSAAAFQYGLLSVDMKREDDGTRIAFAPTGKTSTPDGDIPTLNDKELALFSRAEHVEIGTVIWNASFLPPWFAQPYPVPGSSLALWARTAPPSAEANQSTVPQSNPAPSDSDSATPVPTSPAPKLSAPESERATVVPAGESKQ